MLLGSGQVTTPPSVPMVQEAAGSCRCTTSTNCCKQQSASVEFSTGILAKHSGDALRPDQISCGAVMDAAVKGGNWEWSFTVLSSMGAWRLLPDIFNYNIALNAARRWPHSLWLLGCREAGHAANGITYSNAVTALAAHGCWQFALCMTRRDSARARDRRSSKRYASTAQAATSRQCKLRHAQGSLPGPQRPLDE